MARVTLLCGQDCCWKLLHTRALKLGRALFLRSRLLLESDIWMWAATLYCNYHDYVLGIIIRRKIKSWVYCDWNCAAACWRQAAFFCKTSWTISLIDRSWKYFAVAKQYELVFDLALKFEIFQNKLVNLAINLHSDCQAENEFLLFTTFRWRQMFGGETLTH